MVGMWVGCILAAIAALLCGYGAAYMVSGETKDKTPVTEFFVKQLVAAAWLFSVFAIVGLFFSGFLYWTSDEPAFLPPATSIKNK